MKRSWLWSALFSLSVAMLPGVSDAACHSQKHCARGILHKKHSKVIRANGRLDAKQEEAIAVFNSCMSPPEGVDPVRHFRDILSVMYLVKKMV